MRIGNAPVSYGVYGDVAGNAAASPAGLLATMADAGYTGSELGPPGFFGTAAETAAAFSRQNLTAIGAYVPVHFALGDDVVERDFDGLARTCAELAACAKDGKDGKDRKDGKDGLVILADEGSPELLLNPARPFADRSLALSAKAWRRLAELTARAIEVAARHGLRTSFHPHISTYVESPWEVEWLLALTGVSLTVDTGHVRLAGGDPAECLKAWRPRVNHVHIKDVRLDVLRAAKAEHRTDFDTWWADVATPLGAGDVDIDAVLAVLAGTGYDGWLVVEQDRAPTAAEDYPAVAAEQAANLAWLSRRAAKL
jgi:inosose dehydratase